jgi:hypothetical protein
MEFQPEYHDMKLHDFAIAPGRACLERCSEMQPASAEMAYAVMTTALPTTHELRQSKSLHTSIENKRPDCIHGGNELAERSLSRAAARARPKALHHKAVAPQE